MHREQRWENQVLMLLLVNLEQHIKTASFVWCAYFVTVEC